MRLLSPANNKLEENQIEKEKIKSLESVGMEKNDDTAGRPQHPK